MIGMTADGIVGTIAATIVMIGETSREASVTDWIGDRVTLVLADAPTRITPAIIATAIVIIVKDSAEAIFRAFVNIHAVTKP